MENIPEGSYDREFIMNNPIPARCAKCRRHFIDGDVFRWVDGDGTVREKICNDAIRAPLLEQCRCFYCGGNLRPLDEKSYQQRLAELPKYFNPAIPKFFQPPLFEK